MSARRVKCEDCGWKGSAATCEPIAERADRLWCPECDNATVHVRGEPPVGPKPVRAFAARLTDYRGSQHIDVSSARIMASQARDAAGGWFDAQDPKRGWELAKRQGWRVIPVTITPGD